MNELSHFDQCLSAQARLVGKPNPAAELLAMIDELSQKARRLKGREGDLVHAAGHEAQCSEPLSLKLRRLLRDRERRKTIFAADLFADPAWDILLNLYLSHLEQRRETITGIICLAGVPATTGLRWVHKLVEEDLLVLRDDPVDLRRKFVLLSPKAVAGLEAYFNPETPRPPLEL